MMNRKWALAIQGGGQRAVFSAGVADVLIEAGLFADEVYGCSAGNWIAMNYVQKKKGGAYKLFSGTKPLKMLTPIKYLKGGSLIDFDYYFSEVKNKDLDKNLILSSDIDFFTVVTDLNTCKPAYFNKRDPLFFKACEASCSLATFRKTPLMVGDISALDGGYAERMPFLKPLSEGKKIVMISNRPKSFRFESLQDKDEKTISRRFKEYPNFIDGYINNHLVYHEHLRLLEEEEKKGNIFVIYPPKSIDLSITNTNKDALRAAYELGVDTAKRILPYLKNYLSD